MVVGGGGCELSCGGVCGYPFAYAWKPGACVGEEIFEEVAAGRCRFCGDDTPGKEVVRAATSGGEFLLPVLLVVVVAVFCFSALREEDGGVGCEAVRSRSRRFDDDPEDVGGEMRSCWERFAARRSLERRARRFSRDRALRGEM